MNQVRIPIDADEANWRGRCYARMDSLMKSEAYPISSHSVDRNRVNLDRRYMRSISELQRAVKHGDVDNFVDTLEKACSEPEFIFLDITNVRTPSGNSLFHEAAYLGRTNIAELIGHHFPSLLTERNMEGDTPLHLAARAKSSDVIKLILSEYRTYAHEHSISIKEYETVTRLTNHRGNTALHEAVHRKHLGGVTLLFEADNRATHSSNESGVTPLYLAVLTGNKEILHVLLKAPFPDYWSRPMQHGNSPLHAAILHEDADLINDLLRANTQDVMFMRDEIGRTPIHLAASRGFLQGVRRLLDEFAGIVLGSDEKGNLPIHLASKGGHLEVVKELLKKELQVDDSRVWINKKGQNILHIATKNGREHMVSYILRNTNFNPNEGDCEGNTPLHLASKFCFPNILWSLTRDKRIDVSIKNNEGFTAGDIIERQSSSETIFMPRRQILSYLVLRSVGARSRLVINDALQRRALALIRRYVDTLMVVAALIATVTFAAAFTVPGGIYSSDDSKRGLAVLGNTSTFKIFAISNTAALYSSTLGTFLLLGATLSSDYNMAAKFYSAAFCMLGVALATMSLAFMAAFRLVVTEESWLANLITIVGSIFVCFILSLFILADFLKGYHRWPVLCHLNNFVIKMYISLVGPFPKQKAKKLENVGTSNEKKDQQDGGAEVEDES